MISGIELLLAGAAAVVIAAAGVGATAVLLLGPKLYTSVTFPVKVPGWGTALSSPPPFSSSVEDIQKMNAILLEEARKHKYSKAEVKSVLGDTFVKWVKADPSLGGKRAVLDPARRSVSGVDADGKPTTKPLLVAGYNSGKVITIVYLPDDTLDQTAYAHEVGHALHRVRGIADYGHADMDMYGPLGVVDQANLRFRS